MNPFCEISPKAWEIINQDLAEYLTQYGQRQPLWFIIAFLLAFVVYRVGNWPRYEICHNRLVSFFMRNRLKLLLLVSIFTFCSSILIDKIYLGEIPHVLDSLAHQFQAKVLASGKLYAPIPPEPLDEALNIQFLQQHDGKVFSRTMPLFPMLLALAMKMSMVKFLNPFMNGLTLLLLYLTIRKEMGERYAVIGFLLLAFSPFFIFMGASMMGHPSSLLCSAMVLYGFSLYLQNKNPHGLWLVSLGAGLFALERPYSGFVILLPISIVLLASIWCSSESRKERLAHTILLALPLLLCLLFLGWYNSQLTGSFWTLPRMLTAHYDTPGFGPDKGTPGNPNGHNAIRGLANIAIAVAVLSDDLFGWPGLCLVPALVGLLTPFEKRKTLFGNVVRLTVLLFFFAYFIFHGQGLYFGARYYYCLLPQLLLLTAFGLERLRGKNGEKTPALSLLLLLLTTSSFLTYFPHRLPIFRAYGGISSDAREVASKFSSSCVVLLPHGPNLKHMYLSFASFNCPFLKKGPLFMRDSKKLSDVKLKELLPHLPEVKRLRFPKEKLLTNESSPK